MFLFCIKMLYKHVRFSYYNVSVTVKASKHNFSEANISENIKLLNESFGFTTNEIYAVLANPSRRNLLWKEPGELKESCQFCKKIGFSKVDLLQYPQLLVRHPLVKIHNYNFLRDVGCEPIDAHLLSRSKSYFLNKVLKLKLDGYIQKEVDVAVQLMSGLQPSIEKPKILQLNLSALDQMSITEIHKAILTDWLKKRLDVSDDDLIKLFRIHKMIKNKSFRIINENITLAESLGLSKEKILKCGYLLNNYPEYPKKMLRDHPIFAGLDLAKVYRYNPKMMMVNPRRFTEILAILKEFNVSEKMIRKSPSVFLLNLMTVRNRLEDIYKTPEFRVLINDPHLLLVVVHYHKMRSKLAFLKSLRLRCTSFSNFGNLSPVIFDNYIQAGKDINRPGLLVQFISRLVDKDPAEIRDKLKRHPYYLYVPFVDIQDTFQLLTTIGYSKRDIAGCLTILLYPRDKIMSVMKELEKMPELRFQERDPVKRLNVVLYHLEMEHHFTGNGIWRSDAKMHEEKQLE